MNKNEIRELYMQMFSDYPDIVGVEQLQKMLGISRHFAYDLINSGEIKGLKIANKFKIPKANVILYILEKNKDK